MLARLLAGIAGIGVVLPVLLYGGVLGVQILVSFALDPQKMISPTIPNKFGGFQSQKPGI